MLYFDHNATTPLLAEAGKMWLQATAEYVGNPSSPHRIGARADAALQNARERLAGFLQCDPGEIFWTSGATESSNAVLHHFAQELPGSSEIWISGIEHPCVLEAARVYFPGRHKLIPVTKMGVVDLNWLREELRRVRPGLIAIMAANNETGVLQPWRDAASLCRNHEVPYFCDATQWVGKLRSEGLGQCDYMSGSAHKFGGPRGVGFLKVPLKAQFRSLMFGGKQEDGRRAGTENVPGVLSMLTALENRERLLAEQGHEKRLGYRAEFENALLKKVLGVEIVGLGAERLWNTVSVLMPEIDCKARWVVRLDRFGFAVSTGSACASGREEPSHVLTAMGYAGATSGRVLRFSSGWETTSEHWHELLGGVLKAQESFK